MSEVKKDNKNLTWKEKMEKGIPLSRLDETKATADFNHHQRRREEEAKQEFERKKAGLVSSYDADFQLEDKKGDK